MVEASQLPLGVTGVMLPDIDFEQQVELCRSLNVMHYVYRPRVIPEAKRDQPYHSHGNHCFDLTPQRLLDEGGQLRQALEQAGIVPFATVPATHAGDSEDNLKLHFEGAEAGGAKRVRLTPAPYPGELFDYEKYLEKTIGQYQRAVELARPHGIKLTIEMHANNAAIGPGLAYNIVRHFDPGEVSVIIDLPNFAKEGSVAPILAISTLRDYIDHAHVGGCRTTQGQYDASGFRQAGKMFCPLTESDLSIPAWLEAMGQLGREVPLVVEDFTGNRSGPDRLRDNVEALRRLLN